jgi:hypothetical protein
MQSFIMHCCRRDLKQAKHVSGGAHSMTWKGRMIDERRILRDLEGKGRHCLMEVLSRHLPGGTEEIYQNPVRITSVQIGIRSEYLSSTEHHQ